MIKRVLPGEWGRASGLDTYSRNTGTAAKKSSSSSSSSNRLANYKWHDHKAPAHTHTQQKTQCRWPGWLTQTRCQREQLRLINLHYTYTLPQQSILNEHEKQPQQQQPRQCIMNEQKTIAKTTAETQKHRAKMYHSSSFIYSFIFPSPIYDRSTFK